MYINKPNNLSDMLEQQYPCCRI